MKDTARHQGMRNLLVQQLQEREHYPISDEKVLQAIRTIPRHLFLDSIFEEKAYQDIAFPIDAGQTISRPHTVAFQTELLQVREGQKILEIGTGSGYQSAVLITLNVELYTIERQQELFKKTKIFFEKMGYIPKKMLLGDGYRGYLPQAPYDRILVTAGAPEVPKELLAQLKIGGRIVIPIGKGEQVMTVLVRLSPTEFSKEEYGTFGFVPMLEKIQTRIR
ncbi:protein-L-isoaspartate(D-aspartate) O-methyltransferase [Capnocytophaga sp. oral taxon 338]|uniref:protein-L-isoaspartate(D-aspartate) O-methyltransferase n=1 Tax=Capnocytophaga sp. oral taxon 338 TaxID=710239 RepID=UPI000202E918|nr:protein-L-isoaspartate(D-aspartate) O-methyltransferase [Capnocytophaga sp. oral taxon 338]EGD34212.1 protein-L-isoaspartate(D-aspartate) O-methyltransferase [Capnocytophaga sp. oral taxon 338 str. F0234]